MMGIVVLYSCSYRVCSNFSSNPTAGLYNGRSPVNASLEAVKWVGERRLEAALTMRMRYRVVLCAEMCAIVGVGGQTLTDYDNDDRRRACDWDNKSQVK
ncbi:hypothetical protein GALMADRAFT_886517 [Galerina marginata CBS 339.88]|uniref:Uncharacterized protein n=1 Tax=Galerina marginata (strain CBS 339.88) TaxID=685588 RepID=A0A067SS69_GALM3|nr:hypothetical protein GALMADRAFT_886517 [Galerina marginata CBS 339.88]